MGYLLARVQRDPAVMCFREWEQNDNQTNNRCVRVEDELVSTHLQSDGSWQSWESSGPLVSFLAKHALLSPRSCLAIAALLEVKS